MSTSVLNPMGIFWDIENCSVPSNKPTLFIVEKIRQKFNFCGPEVEFVCVCDVSKERQDVIDDLNSAQVTVIHVSATSKNAADDKLKSSLRKFSNTHAAPGTIILITSDVNFAPELNDLRYRCGFDIILLHRSQVSEALLVVAHQKYNWTDDILLTVCDKPDDNHKQIKVSDNKLVVCGLPSSIDVNRIRERLQQLSSNCGGRVVNVDKSLGTALIRFCTPEITIRALKRLQNENVYGSRICVKSFRSPNTCTVAKVKVLNCNSLNYQQEEQQIVASYSQDERFLTFDNTTVQVSAKFQEMLRLPADQQSCVKRDVSLEQILYLFLHCPDKELTLKELQNDFRSEFGYDLLLTGVTQFYDDILEFFEGRSRIIGVRLTPVQKFALRARRLLLNFNGDVLLTDFEKAYYTCYGDNLRPRSYGLPSLIGLLRSVSHVLYMKGRGRTLTVCINRNFLGFQNNNRRLTASDVASLTTPSPSVPHSNQKPYIPLATSSPHAEDSASREFLPEIGDSKNKNSKIVEDGPFFNFLQNRFLFSSTTTPSNDARPLFKGNFSVPQSCEEKTASWLASPINQNCFACYDEDAKLTNSSSTSEICCESLALSNEIVYDNRDMVSSFNNVRLVSPINEDRSTMSSPCRRNRLAANFLNFKK